MDKQVNISSRQALEAWLEGKPREWAQVLAMRLALRVFPLTLDMPTRKGFSIEQKQGLIVQVWRANFFSSVARKYPTYEMRSDPRAAALAAAFAAARAATRAAARAAAHAADAAALATRTAARAAAFAAADAADAADAAAHAADAADAAPQIWNALNADIGFLTGYGTQPESAAAHALAEQALWPLDVPDIDLTEHRLPHWAAEPLDAFEREAWDEQSSFKLIADWYRAQLQDPPSQLLGDDAAIAIATQSRDFWQIDEKRTAKIVMDDIVRVAREYGTTWDPVVGAQAPLKVIKGNVFDDLSKQSAAQPSPVTPSASQNNRPTQADVQSDHPDATVDHLNRSGIAFQLAGRINQIWDSQNPDESVRHGKTTFFSCLWTGIFGRSWNKTLKTGFVVHIDAPWGGGKTNFAGFITRILNPWRDPDPVPQWLTDLKLQDDKDWMERYRRPWLVVHFNAWKHEHVQPPWWTFAEAIREQCMEAISHEVSQRARPETDEHGKPLNLPAPEDNYAYKGWFARKLCYFAFWLREIWWRFFTPANRSKLIVVVLCVAIATGLLWSGWFTADNGKLEAKAPTPATSQQVAEPDSESVEFSGTFQIGDNKIEFSGAAPETPEPDTQPEIGSTGLTTTNLLTILIFLATAVGAVWQTVSAFVTSLVPGTPDAAKNYSLGSGDPLERFRKHFASTIAAFQRPVVVVVDDLDRCDPKYVVDLVRGMQTVMVSPRIVYLLLGDRDWIEKAFAQTHKAMAGIDVGPEHSFGGRFVEKAIQMSFVLPEVDDEKSEVYVRRLLTPDAPDDETQPTDEERATEAQLAQRLEAEVLKIDNFARREQKAAELFAEIDISSLSEPKKKAVKADAGAQLARKAATDDTVEEETGHMLVGLAPLMPGNPRQIKRIINSITILQQIARTARENFQPLASSQDWQILARWIVIMTEWPQTWFTLTKEPDIMRWVINPKLKQGDKEAEIQAAYAKLIVENERVMDLLLMRKSIEGWQKTAIDTDAIEWLKKLMPATSGSMLELPKPQKPDEQADGAQQGA